MRSDNLFSKRAGAVLEAPEDTSAPSQTARRRSRRPEDASRRDFPDDFASNLPGSEDEDTPSRRAGYRVRFQSRALRTQKTLWGRIFTAFGLVVVAGCAAVGYLAIRSFFLHDPRFTIASSSAIQTAGNTHLTRPQLLSVFGEDVDRNIFNVPLVVRRAELDSLPWIQHATVMRLLPNHLRISIVERTPVAFVRQGSQIGLVDANGVLLDMPPDAPGDPHYSFPVLTGIAAADPLSTRAARMKIFSQFSADLNSGGDHVLEKLSEVDLSNPEDVKALIPEDSSDILVHFGDTDFLARYRKFEDHLQEWRTQYPKLASVDMRYERQVVLEMQPGTPTTSAPDASPAPNTLPAPATARPASKSIAKPTIAVNTPPAKPSTLAAHKGALKPASKPDSASAQPAANPSAKWHMVVVKPHTKAAAAIPAKAKPTHPPQAATQ